MGGLISVRVAAVAAAEEPPKPAAEPAKADEAPKPALDKEKPQPQAEVGEDKKNGAGALDRLRETVKKAQQATREAQKEAEQKAPPAPQPAPKARPLPAQIQMRGAAAPLNRGIGRTNESGEDDPIFFPADRTTLQRLSKAQEQLEQQRYGEAVRLLGDILEGPEDYFFQPKRDEPIHRSLKAEAQRLIGELPREGLASYELQYGAMAQQKLDEAIAQGDNAALAEVSRRFFHTKAGYEATFLLATLQLDHGHPLAAALAFRRLQGTPGAAQFEPLLTVKMAACWARAGMADKAQETLQKLSPAVRRDKMMVAGKPLPLFNRDEDALSWLSQVVGAPSALPVDGADQWAMYRGSPTRNTISNGSSPLLSRRWGVRTADENGGMIEEMIQQLRESSKDQGAGQLCSLHPLAVKDYVFMRSVGGLVAINFATGKRVWRGPVDDSIRQLLDPTSASRVTQQVRLPNINAARLMINPVAKDGTRWLQARLWEDSTYGTMSSDGQRVFCIEDLDTGLGVAEQRQIVNPNGRRVTQPISPRSFNRLAAYDIATEGKLKWEAGGPLGDGRGELAGAFFLGSPLPLADSVYALTELKGEIRLVAIDATSGKLEWSQQLAVLESIAGLEQLRRSAGVSPSFSDGVLVCPTAAGAIVALDMTTRSLLWGYQYSRTEGMPAEMARAGGLRAAMVPNGAVSNDRWVDASVTIAGGRVLLTPPESNQLHCLNLLDGKLLWQKPRDDGLYVGCVHNDSVLIVGRNSLRALKLSDGESAWDESALPLPTGSTPSGRGFFNGQRYHLPLSSAEVAAIDVDTGRIVARSKSRSGTIPGNLICYRGAVISQNIDVIERFDQRDDLWQQILAAIAADPNDAGALARRGELLLDEGNFRDATESLRKSYALVADPRTRELLVDALLEGLRVDFAANREQLAEVERLIDRPAQLSAFLRLSATGWQESGDLPAAFAACMRIAGLETGGNELERVDHALSVRRDRWVQARLKGLLDAASPQDRAEMDKAIQARLEAAIQTAGSAALRQFLAYFGGLAIADEAREQLVTRLAEEGALVEAEQLLRRLEVSSDPRRAAIATARYAALLESAGRPDEAVVYYKRLGERFADVTGLGGQTGKQLVDAIPAKAAVRPLLTPGDAFPLGVVEHDESKGQPGVVSRHVALDLLGSLAPFHEFMTLNLDQHQQALVGMDGLGRERWRVSLRDPNQSNNNNNFLGNGQSNPARVSGHVVLVSLGSQILAIDSLGSPGGEGTKVLWRHDLVERSAGGAAAPFQPQPHVIQLPWAGPRLVVADQLGRPIGNIGPITPDLACYQRMRSVVAVHPLTGETLWSRNDVEPGSDIFGDEEQLFIVASNSDDALVVRSLDGQELGRRKVPPSLQRMTTFGRRLASWSTENGKATLQVTDPWEQRELWHRDFHINAKAWIVSDEGVGVMTPDGHFLLLALADGKPLIDENVTAESQLSEIYVLRGPDQYILAANHPAQMRNGINHQPVTGGVGNPLISGHVHIFDRHTGKKIGSTQVDRHGLLLSQPAALPVLTFATHVYDQRNNRARSVEAAVIFLDKRTGKIVYDEKLQHQIASVDLVGDPDRHQVVMKTQGSAIRLTFTGKPAESDEAANAESAKESEAKVAGKAVLRGLQNWFQSVNPQPLPIPIEKPK